MELLSDEVFEAADEVNLRILVEGANGSIEVPAVPRFERLVHGVAVSSFLGTTEGLRFPSGHRKRLRSTNLLERSFVEVRRRTKVIGRFPARPWRCL